MTNVDCGMSDAGTIPGAPRGRQIRRTGVAFNAGQ